MLAYHLNFNMVGYKKETLKKGDIVKVIDYLGITSESPIESLLSSQCLLLNGYMVNYKEILSKRKPEEGDIFKFTEKHLDKIVIKTFTYIDEEWNKTLVVK